MYCRGTLLTMSDSAFDVLSMPSVTLDSLIASGAIRGFSDFEPHILSRIITDGETDIHVCALIVDQNLQQHMHHI